MSVMTAFVPDVMTTEWLRHLDLAMENMLHNSGIIICVVLFLLQWTKFALFVAKRFLTKNQTVRNIVANHAARKHLTSEKNIEGN